MDARRVVVSETIEHTWFQRSRKCFEAFVDAQFAMVGEELVGREVATHPVKPRVFCGEYWCAVECAGAGLIRGIIAAPLRFVAAEELAVTAFEGTATICHENFSTWINEA